MIPELLLSIMMAGGGVGVPQYYKEPGAEIVEHDPFLDVYNKWGDLLADHFNEEDLYLVSKIIWCESRGKETARNPKGSAAPSAAVATSVTLIPIVLVLDIIFLLYI